MYEQQVITQRHTCERNMESLLLAMLREEERLLDKLEELEEYSRFGDEERREGLSG